MSHSKAECHALLKKMAQDERILILAADVETSCGMSPVRKAFPHRIINVGIAEQNMLGVAAGLAHEGFLPLTHTFSAFSSMRSCEQLRTDIFYNDLNVKVIGTHSGLSTGPAGSTHFSLEDIGIVRSMPGSRIMLPADDRAAEIMTEEILDDPHPIYLRLDRNDLPEVYHGEIHFPLGGSHQLRSGEDVAVFAAGAMVHVALQAAAILESKGIQASVTDMYSIKPLDETMVAAAARCGKIVTIEEHHIIGGLGSAVAETVLGQGMNCKLLRLGLPDSYPMGGPVHTIRRRAGLTAEQVADKIEKWG